MVDRLILVGMMGAGKTTVGRLLADRLGWRSFDSDAQIMEATGHTVPELFAERGEAAFRAEEERVLAEALSGDQPVVVSAAGGVVLSAANRALLARSGTVVWLRPIPGSWPGGWGTAPDDRCWTRIRRRRWPPCTRCAGPSTTRWRP